MAELEIKEIPKILVLDDERHSRIILSEAVRSLGYKALEVEKPSEALLKIRTENFDVLITDLQMPEMDGLSVLEKARINDPNISVVVVTAHGTIETAISAIQKGAEDYLLKPIEFSGLEIVLKKVLNKRALVRENRKLLSENEALKRDLSIRYHYMSGLGKSQKAQAVLEKVKFYMKNKAPVLILGHAGVGKIDIARMIHYNSPWAQSSFITFESASVPVELHEVCLFGEEGTQSIPARLGLVEKAHVGTLIIEDIEKLEKNCQTRLCRVLQEQKIQRVNGRSFYPAVIRLIATSEQTRFEEAKNSQMFREDLYFILNENKIEITPLRDRKEDIPFLIAATMKRVAQAWGKEIKSIDPKVIEKLMNYDFPGNNRELEAMIESAVLRCQEGTLKFEHFVFLK